MKVAYIPYAVYGLAVSLLSKSAPLQAFLWVVFWTCMALFWKMGEKGCVLVLKEGDRGIKLRTRLSPDRVMVWVAQGACLVRAKVGVPEVFWECMG